MDWILLWLNSAKAQRGLWFQIEPLAQVNCKLEIFQYFRYISFQRKWWIWKGKMWSVNNIGYIFGNTTIEGAINVVGLLSWFLPFFLKEIIFVTPSLPNLYNSESAYQVVSVFFSLQGNMGPYWKSIAGFCEQTPAQRVKSIFFSELLKTSFAGNCKICEFAWPVLRNFANDNTKQYPKNEAYQNLAELARYWSPEQPLILQSNIIMQHMVVQPADINI